jgi:CheY-like chemotaxis protein
MTGVALAEGQLPDLIFVDLSLPGLDGWEATRQIRANPVTATILIIAVTAHASREEVQDALRAGCNQYETKPLVYARLIKKIRTQLESRTEAAELAKENSWSEVDGRPLLCTERWGCCSRSLRYAQNSSQYL